jgi:hypothetical protein
MALFSLLSGRVMTANGVSSEAVPDVVATQIMWTP